MKATQAGGPRGYDAAEKVTGRKRHIAVDTQGLLLGVVVHAASIQDADGAGSLLGRIEPLYRWLRAVFADGGCNRVPAILACFLLGLTLLIVSRPRGAKGFVLLPRRRDGFAVLPFRGIACGDGGGARTWLAWALAPAVQGLRAPARGVRGHG